MFKKEIMLDLKDYSDIDVIHSKLIKGKKNKVIVKGKNYELHDLYVRVSFKVHDQYFISEDGTHVINSYNGTIKLASANSDNYRKFFLYNKETKKMDQVYAHRLMAHSWGIRGSNSLNREVDHIDRDRGNNKLENLRWVSRAENLRNRNKW